VASARAGGRPGGEASMLTTITRLRCYGMACGSVDGWVGGWVDGDDGLSLPVPVRLPSRSCVVVQTHTCRAADFFVCGNRSGKDQDQNSWLLYRLQTTARYEQCNNGMRGGEQRGERDEGLEAETRTIDTKPFWTLAILLRSNCDAGGGF
jgi:hypothetical protein